MTPTSATTPLTIPELGPSLGRLVAPPTPPPGAPSHWIALEDIRLDLVSQLFDLAGDARRWVREGDRPLALATLDREAWHGAWQRAVQATAERAAAEISVRLLAAAREARLPARRTRTLALDAREVQALGARLSHGAAPFLQAAGNLDRAAPPARLDRAPVAAVRAWQEALTTVARRLEAAWLALEEALGREWLEWDREVEDLRRWRRPLLPLVLLGVGLFALALYAGLVLGGFLPVPGPLRGIIEEIWGLWS